MLDDVWVYTRIMADACYCILMRKASRKMSSLYDEALSPLGINVAQFSLMRTVQKRAPVSLTDLARYLELDRSTVGRNAKVLERRGLIQNTRGEDQREALLSITPAGERLLDSGVPLWDSVQARIGKRFSATEGALQALIDEL